MKYNTRLLAVKLYRYRLIDNENISIFLQSYNPLEVDMCYIHEVNIKMYLAIKFTWKNVLIQNFTVLKV